MSKKIDDIVQESEDYFLENKNPYFRVKKGLQIHTTKFYFPGGYLAFISKENLTNCRESSDKFYNNLDESLQKIPNNVKIYLMIYNLDNLDRSNSEFQEIYENFDEEFGFDRFGNGIELITQINQIKIVNTPFVIEMPHILRAMKLNPVCEYLKSRKLVCDQYAYQRFLAVSDQQTIEYINKKYNLEILETKELENKYPFRIALSFKKSSMIDFHRFEFCLDGYLENIDITEKPIKYIHNVSHLCQSCNKYFFIRKDETIEDRNICFKCFRNSKNN